MTGKGQTARWVAIATAFFVIGMAAPAVGTSLQRAVFANNSDRVDGFHAVGAAATTAQRKGKLVATNRKGRLPNNIIKKAPNAAKLGGTPAGSYVRGWELLKGEPVFVDIGQYASAVVTCPAGKHILGANFTTTDGVPDSPTVFRSIINDEGTSVSFTAFNGTGSNDRAFRAWAICAKTS